MMERGDANATSRLLAILKSSVLYALPDALFKLVNFLLVPILTNVLTQKEIGTLTLMTLTLDLVFQIFSLGFNSAAFREVIYNDVLLVDVMRTGFWTNTLTFTILLFLMAIFSKNISLILSGTSCYYNSFLFFTLASFFFYLGKWALVKYRILKKPLKFAFISVLRILIYSFLTVLIIGKLHYHIEGVAISRLISNLVFFVVGLVVLKEIRVFKIKFSLLKSMLFFGFPLVIGSLGFWGMSYADNYFLRIYTDLEQVGIYSIAYRIGMSVLVAVMGIQMAWPVELYRIAKREDASVYFGKIIFQYFCVIGSLVLFVSIFAKEILMLLTPEPYWQASRVIPLVALSYFFMGLKYMVNVGTNLTGKTYFQTITLVISLIFNIILNILLIPSYGYMGAAWATFISFSLLLLMDIIINQSLFYVKFNYIRFLILGLLGITMYLLSTTLNFSGLWMYIVVKFVFLLVFVVISGILAVRS